MVKSSSLIHAPYLLNISNFLWVAVFPKIGAEFYLWTSTPAFGLCIKNVRFIWRFTANISRITPGSGIYVAILYFYWRFAYLDVLLPCMFRDFKPERWFGAITCSGHNNIREQKRLLLFIWNFLSRVFLRFLQVILYIFLFIYNISI